MSDQTAHEAKILISQLEEQRDELVQFAEELQRQVVIHELAEATAAEILRRQLGGRNYEDTIRSYNRHIQEALLIIRDEREHRVGRGLPLALVLIVGLGLAWQLATLTGLVTFDDETFYRLPMGMTLSETASVALDITDNISSLRISGRGTTSGTTRIELVAQGATYLVAESEGDEGPSAITGFTVDEITVEGTNETNDTKETNVTDIVTVSTENDTDPGQNNTTSVLLPVTIAVDPVLATPVPTPLERAVTWDNECLETCQLPTLSAPYGLQVTLDEGGSFTIESIVYGVPDTVPTPSVIEQQPVQQPADDEPTQAPPIIPLANQTIPIQNTTPVQKNTIPSVACTTDADCAAGVCVHSVLAGAAQNGLCVTPPACVAADVTYTPGSTTGDSICLSNGREAIWIVQSGQGRFEITSSANRTVAIIDRYGSMAIAGSATVSGEPVGEGWVIGDEQGVARLIIDDSGNLITSGAIRQLAAPQQTNRGDFVIEAADGSAKAIITQQGDVVLSGALLTGAQLGGN